MPTDTRHPYRPAAVRAFTLIEILVVVGILGLLIALTVIGFRVVGGMGKSRVTEVALANCAGLLTSYKETSAVEKLIDTGTNTSTMGKILDAERWHQADTNSGVTKYETDISNAHACTPNVDEATGDAQTDANKRLEYERYLRDETARVIRRLMTVPANRKAIEAMSPDRLQKIRVPFDPSKAANASLPDFYNYTPAGDYFDGVVLLDGSGQPIYFVPGGGLHGVHVGYLGSGDKAKKASYERPNQTILAPDRGPFWASPGPDGDLTTGDDNVYSFGEVTASK